MESQITRLPRAYDVSLGQEALDRLGDIGPDCARLIAGAAGSSPYLKTLIDQESDWLPKALSDPESAIASLLTGLHDSAPDRLNTDLRRAKRRVALLVALADLAGAWALDQVTGTLTEFADLACDLTLRAEIAAQIGRGKLPGQTEDDIALAGGMTVLAMGKMGAGELNYSSDIDLICLVDETRYDRSDFADARRALVQATRRMCARLSDRTADGYVFRTDLRLRPDSGVTPVCMAMAAAETYYESQGRTWERAAYIKARAAAGDTAAGSRFIATLHPFVWRRHLDFAAIQDAHDMRLRIRHAKGFGGPLTVPGHDMKLGRGGIREIEFFAQTRQLIAGGRDPSLRQRGTEPALTALAAKGWVSAPIARDLAAHYRAHREVEHRIQMLHDAQTHKVPANAEDGDRLACLMGTDRGSLMAVLAERLEAVHNLCEGFFAPHSAARPEPAEEPPLDTSICKRWPGYPALRSERAQQIFDRLRPELMHRLARTARPDEALAALDGFLAGLPAGVQLFSLFEANPQLIDLLIDIVGTAPALAGYLARNSSVFDAVIDGGFFAQWPGYDTLQKELLARMRAEPDYEARLDAARRWMKEWHFRIGVHHLRGLIGAEEAGAQYADLAEAVIAALLPIVTEQFSAKHGPPPGRGAAVLGMGSLGARRLNAGSDLDLIVIYDPQNAEASDGQRPLPARTYFARLTQALITALTAPMSQGRLYEVDMRLRPSGNQGPVATSWASFRSYQQTEAWIWEHMALTRARVVAAMDTSLTRDIEEFRRTLLTRPRARAEVLSALQDMRRRLADATTPSGVWDAKTGPGRMLDIELLSQTGAVLAGVPARNVADALTAAADCGWLPAQDAVALQQAHRLCWSVVTAMRLLNRNQPISDPPGAGGAAFLCRSAGFDDLESLRIALDSAYAASGTVIDRAASGEVT